MWYSNSAQTPVRVAASVVVAKHVFSHFQYWDFR